MSKVICKYWGRGRAGCLKGDACEFRHPGSSRPQDRKDERDHRERERDSFYGPPAHWPPTEDDTATTRRITKRTREDEERWHMDGNHEDLRPRELVVVEPLSPLPEAKAAAIVDELPTIVLPPPPAVVTAPVQQPLTIGVGETKGQLISTLNDCADISAKLSESAAILTAAATDIRARLSLLSTNRL